jgi:hypothetical protein
VVFVSSIFDVRCFCTLKLGKARSRLSLGQGLRRTRQAAVLQLGDGVGDGVGVPGMEWPNLLMLMLMWLISK